MTDDPAAVPRRPSRWRRRLLAAGLGLLLTLVLLEGALWAIYAVQKPEPSFEMGPVGEGGRTILCIGDSNTYGIHLARNESYPGQLQSFLDRWSASPWRVVNVGYPGHNSAEVRGRLARHLEEYRPEVVICWVGVNNTWSFASRHLWRTPDSEVEPRGAEKMLQRVRVLKLARMVINQLSSKLGAGFEGAGKVVTPEHIHDTLVMDYRRIREICAAHGARLLMSDYPVHIRYTEETVNRSLHEVAAAIATPIVPLHERVLPVAYGLGYAKIMFADYHATRLGNYEVARLMLRALMEHGLLEPRPEWEDIPPLALTLATWPIRVASYDRARAVLDLHGPPAARYRLRLSRLYARGGDKTRGLAVAYKPYEGWSEAELAERGLAGALGLDGATRVEISLPPEPEHPQAPGEPVTWLGWRFKVEYASAAGEALGKLSDPVDVLLDPAVVAPASGE